jgi:hypothetical protein
VPRKSTSRIARSGRKIPLRVAVIPAQDPDRLPDGTSAGSRNGKSCEQVTEKKRPRVMISSSPAFAWTTVCASGCQSPAAA